MYDKLAVNSGHSGAGDICNCGVRLHQLPTSGCWDWPSSSGCNVLESVIARGHHHRHSLAAYSTSWRSMLADEVRCRKGFRTITVSAARGWDRRLAKLCHFIRLVLHSAVLSLDYLPPLSFHSPSRPFSHPSPSPRFIPRRLRPTLPPQPSSR